jgi:hypothetical protein
MTTPLVIAGSLVGASLAAAAPVTTATLLEEMVDLERLAAFPDPPFKVTQFSSYDRTSLAPYAPGWHANSDGFGGEPTPNFEAVLKPPNAQGVGRYLMLDVQGPGAIVRCWTAAIEGEITVYLDSSNDPLFQGSAGEFLGDTYAALARQAGISAEPDSSGFRQEEACYFPIPFARRCRVEWTGDVNRIHFYHLEVRRYPAGTPVRTFALSDLKTHAALIDRVQEMLRDPDARWQPRDRGRTVSADGVRAEPGKRVELLKLEQGGVIRQLTLRVQADDLRLALRQIVLEGYFDGAPRPQIEAPIGDFFGSGPGLSPFDSLPVTVRPNGSMTCRLPMPFRQSAVFLIQNLGEQEAEVSAEASVADHRWQEGRSLHLFAKWRVDHGLTAGAGDEIFDLPYLCARGRGTLVGVAAMLMNPSAIPTSYGNWWGEGDEKVWVDDDRFPSLFGTGSEDYFNYAWSRPTLFSHGYCAQPLDTGPDNRGFVANIRWHILDALPFEKSLDFFMELNHHTRTPGLTYARIAWFYAEPWTRDDFVPITPADVTQGLSLPENWQPVAAFAAQGATFYQAEDALVGSPGNTEIVTDAQMWSAGKLVLWKPRSEGETIRLKVNVEQAGRYAIVATCAMTPTSGRFTVAVDESAPLEPVADLYTPFHTMLRNHYFQSADGQPVELAAGEHVLTLTAQGRRDASGGSDVGIDFVWVLPR